MTARTSNHVIPVNAAGSAPGVLDVSGAVLDRDGAMRPAVSALDSVGDAAAVVPDESANVVPGGVLTAALIVPEAQPATASSTVAVNAVMPRLSVDINVLGSIGSRPHPPPIAEAPLASAHTYLTVPWASGLHQQQHRNALTPAGEPVLEPQHQPTFQGRRPVTEKTNRTIEPARSRKATTLTCYADPAAGRQAENAAG